MQYNQLDPDSCSEAAEEEESLLFNNQEKCESTPRKTQKLRRCISRIAPWVSHTILMSLCLYLWLDRHTNKPKCMYKSKSEAEQYSPVEDIVDYKPQIFTNKFDDELSIYQGWPSDEGDAAWDDLYLYGISIRIEEERHRNLFNKTEKAPVEGFENDYVVGLGVFHQLHCLNMIRMSFYPQRYNMSMVDSEGNVEFEAWRHIDHCIESLRQTLMCYSDTTTITMHWTDENVIRPKLKSAHMCRDFTKLRDWAFDRYVDFGNFRQHVENGVVVDYTGDGPNPYDQPIPVPDGWNKKVQDM